MFRPFGIHPVGGAMVLGAVLTLTMPLGHAVTGEKKDDGAPQAIEIKSDNPLSGNAEAIAAGRKLYNTFCAQCHGAKADGNSPRFGKYAADLRQFNKGFYEFVGIVAEGIVDKQMPPWGEYFDGDQISSIGAYLETLSIEGAVWSAQQ